MQFPKSLHALWGLPLLFAAGCPAVSDDAHQQRIDADGDGQASDAYPGGTDCDDGDDAVNSGATELCNGVDDDCDGVIDDVEGSVEWFEDGDGDGVGDVSLGTPCVPPADAVEVGGDCNDADPNVAPGAEEQCNGNDDDCDGTPDDGLAGSKPWYGDADGDGFGVATDVVIACFGPEGYADNPSDCNDDEPSVNPTGVEACNGLDDDCNGAVDDGLDSLTVWYLDGDGDGFGLASTATLACVAPPDHVDVFGDCDDTESAIRPGAPETCSPADENCDGDPTAGATDGETWYRDADADGFGSIAVTVAACTAPPGFVEDASDCNDLFEDIFPGADETCDDRDEDCDEVIDNDPIDPLVFYADADGDGYGDVDAAVDACVRPAGHVSDSRDCNDSESTSHPNAEELCNNQDDDCDGAVDEVQPTWYADADGDGWGDASDTKPGCSQPTGYVSRAGDCNDESSSVNPAAAERCNNVDDNCDGLKDGPDSIDRPLWFGDMDADGRGDSQDTRRACSAPDGYVGEANDCNDDEPLAWTGAAEVCADGVDNDCDGLPGSCVLPSNLNSAEGAVGALVEEGVSDGWRVFGPGDMTGDGLADLVVSGLELKSNGTKLGGVRIYRGPDLESGDDTPWATINGPQKETAAGFSLAGAGDVDQDGTADLWVGAPESSIGGGSRGAVYLLTGAMAAAGSNLSTTPTRVLGAENNERLGWSVASADLVGSTGLDLVTGSPEGEPQGEAKQGVVRIFSGPFDGGDLGVGDATTVLQGRRKDALSGSALVTADLNGDGAADLVVGSPKDKFETGDALGGASIYFGPLAGGVVGPSDEDVVVRGSMRDSLLGSALAAGDLTGDGTDDLVVAGPLWDVSGFNEAGRVLVFAGGSLPALLGPAAAWATINGNASNMGLGTGVASAGDVDGSGVSDLWVGAPGYQDKGAAGLYLDLEAGVHDLDDADGLLTGARSLGLSVAGPGDLNGDGVLDLVAGDSEAQGGEPMFMLVWGVAP